MSSTANPEPESPAAEELVAYLDGELPPDLSRRVEERLHTDDHYRRQLQSLDRAWTALDSLPSAKPSDDFARTTMELVTVAAENEVRHHLNDASAAARRRRIGLLAVGVAAVAAGFVLSQAVLPDRNHDLLADLPVIRHADLLLHVDDVEFLRRLPEVVPLQQLTNGAVELDEPASQWATIGGATHDQRRRWIEALPPEDKASLAVQARRFDELPPAEQERLRELERHIRKADDAAVLQQTLLAYGRWASSLSPGEQEQLHDELRDVPVDEQLRRVRQFVRRTSQRASRQLSDEDAEKLREAIFAFVEERRPAILSQIGARGDDGPRRLEGPRGALFVLTLELRDRQRENELYERLTARLSPQAQTDLEQLRPWTRRWQLWQWIRDALEPKWGPGELEQFFLSDQLDNDQRQRLLNMRPGEMQAELERLYLGAHFGFRDMGPPWLGPPPHRDNRQPPRRPASRPPRADENTE